VIYLLAYTDINQGKPLIFLHGWGASSLIFERIVIPRMQGAGENYRFIAVDLPGHGKNGKLKSPNLKRKEVIQHIVDSVMKSIDDAGVEEFALVGYSFGATIALHIASQHKDRVKVLVVNDPILKGSAFELYRRWGFHILYNLLKPFGETRFILKIINNTWAHKIAKIIFPNLFVRTRPDESGLKKQIEEIKEYDKRNTNPRFWAAGIDALFAPSAEFAAMQIDCPTLIVAGDNAPYAAVDSSIKLQHLVKAKGRKQVVEVYVIKNSGHHVISTNPDEFSEKVANFLREHYE